MINHKFKTNTVTNFIINFTVNLIIHYVIIIYTKKKNEKRKKFNHYADSKLRKQVNFRK